MIEAAMRKAAAAAEQTIKEMGITAERDTDPNNKPPSTPTRKELTPTKHSNPTNKPETRPKLNKNPPDDSKNEEDNSNSSSETSSQKRSYTEKKPKEKQKKKRKTPKKKQKKKQSHILQAGPDGKAQLAGSSPGIDDDNTTEEETVKDKKYYKKLVKDRERPFNFRVNFILLLEDPTGTLEQKKAKAIDQLKKEVCTFSLLDPTLVLNPWRDSSPIIAPPMKIEDFEQDTTLHRYCKTVYINPNTPDKARFNFNIAVGAVCI